MPNNNASEQRTGWTGPACACVHWDSIECARLRYGRIDRFDHDAFDECECGCHDAPEDEEDSYW